MFLLGIGLGAIAFVFAPRVRLRPAAAPKLPVVAVLPFDNRSAEPELELVASSIASAVVAELEVSGRGRVTTVPADTSLMFKDVEGGIGRVAAELDADYVIAGSIDIDGSSEGEPIRVDVYLYRAGVDEALWAERLDWAAGDADAIASELARRIAGSLSQQ